MCRRSAKRHKMFTHFQMKTDWCTWTNWLCNNWGDESWTKGHESCCASELITLTSLSTPLQLNHSDSWHAGAIRSWSLESILDAGMAYLNWHPLVKYLQVFGCPGMLLTGDTPWWATKGPFTGVLLRKRNPSCWVTRWFKTRVGQRGVKAWCKYGLAWLSFG